MGVGDEDKVCVGSGVDVLMGVSMKLTDVDSKGVEGVCPLHAEISKVKSDKTSIFLGIILFFH